MAQGKRKGNESAGWIHLQFRCLCRPEPNAFIGNYLRMEILHRWREYGKIIHEVKDYFYNIAKTTGTLWEHARIVDSLNHGFTSYAGVAILKAMFGIQKIDLDNRTVTLDNADVGLNEASCCIDTPFGPIDIAFTRENGKLQVSRQISGEFKVKKFSA
ncbi:MAG TPA: hypothetical protein DCY35_12095 [Prolixibacteraceae bacterium]|nr:hypothetical protein [Prolixibacteraceae bacterium]